MNIYVYVYVNIFVCVRVCARANKRRCRSVYFGVNMCTNNRKRAYSFAWWYTVRLCLFQIWLKQKNEYMREGRLCYSHKKICDLATCTVHFHFLRSMKPRLILKEKGGSQDHWLKGGSHQRARGRVETGREKPAAGTSAHPCSQSKLAMHKYSLIMFSPISPQVNPLVLQAHVHSSLCVLYA